MKSAMGNITVQDAMVTEFATLRPSDPLKRALDLTLATSQKDFPVVEGEEVKGIIVQTTLFNVLQRLDHNSSVEEVMVCEFDSVDSLDSLETAFMKLKSCNCQSLPVLRNGQLLGLLTSENVDEYLKIQSALGKVPKRGEWRVDAV